MMKFKAIDFKAIGIKVLRSCIPLILIAAIAFSLFYLASEGDAVKYANITEADYELGEHTYTILEGDIPECVYSGFDPVAQNDRFIMYVNGETANVAIFDSVTGRTVTTTIPEEEIEKAAPGNYDTEASMRSNFVLNAVKMEDGSTTEFSAYDSLTEDAGGKVQISSLSSGDGVRITYLIGRIPKIFLIPSAVSEKRYNEIIAQLEEVDWTYALEFEDRYRPVDLTDIYGEERDELIAKFPNCENELIYFIPEGTKEFIMEKVEEALAQINYTEEQKIADETAVMRDTGEEAYTVFRIPMEFKLQKDNFAVSVDRGGIRYSEASLPISIEVCPYLMRAYDNENGYMLFPDGSGSLLNLNNGKTNLSESYMTRVYGEDPLYYDNFSRVEDVKAQLPVCGLKTENGGMFAYISECDGEATLYGHISGKTSKTNNAVVQFKLFGFVKEMVLQDWTATGGSGTIFNNRIHGDKISGKTTTEYYFMEKDKCEYTNMATLCREILIKKGKLVEVKDANNNTALINLLGVYDYVDSILGVPVNSDKVMTTAKQATEIINTLKKSGIKLDARYLAAVNGGFKQYMADGMSLESGIGSDDELKTLISAVKGAGGKLYMDLAFTKVYRNGTFDGFSVANDSVAKITTKHTTFFTRDPISFYYVKTPHYYLAPAKFKENMLGVLEDVKELGVEGISFRNMGETLYSDADVDNFKIRSEIATMFTEAANEAAKQRVSLMYNGGGAYVFSNASYLSGIPSDCADYAITDEAVPFLQMVIHGDIAYTYGSTIDAANVKKFMLDSVATGAKLQFNVSAKNSFELKNTEYTNYYNTSWDSNKDDIIKYCEFVKEAVEATSAKKFTAFERINENVTKSVFEDVTVYVNYSDKDYSEGGITIKAQDYTVVK